MTQGEPSADGAVEDGTAETGGPPTTGLSGQNPFWSADRFARAFASALLVLLFLGVDMLGFESASDAASRAAYLKFSAVNYPDGTPARPPLSEVQVAAVKESPVLVILIDENSLPIYKAADWPLPYEDFAFLLDQIVAANPAAIVWDIGVERNRNSGNESVDFRDETKSKLDDAITGASLALNGAFYMGASVEAETATESPEPGEHCKKVQTSMVGQSSVKVGWVLPEYLYPLQVCENDVLYDSAAYAGVKAWYRANYKTEPASLFPQVAPRHRQEIAPPMVLQWRSRPIAVRGFERHDGEKNNEDEACSAAHVPAYAGGGRGSISEQGFWQGVKDASARIVATWGWYMKVLGDGLFGGTKSVNDKWLRQCTSMPVPYVFAQEFITSAFDDRYENKIIFVGADVIGLDDIRISPVQGGVPGVFWHAMAADNLLSFGPEYLRESPYVGGSSAISVQDVSEFMFALAIIYIFSCIAVSGQPIKLALLALVYFTVVIRAYFKLTMDVWHIFPTNWLALYGLLFLATLSVVGESLWERYRRRRLKPSA